MKKAIYIATSEANSGKSIVTLGLMRMLLGKTPKVGYFRPIIDNVKKGKKDNHINTIISHFQLDIDPNDAYAFTRSEFITMRNNGKEGEIFDTIISKYKALEDKNDFMLVEGTDFSVSDHADRRQAGCKSARDGPVRPLQRSCGQGREHKGSDPTVDGRPSGPLWSAQREPAGGHLQLRDVRVRSPLAHF